jgi:hypothetical protein
MEQELESQAAALGELVAFCLEEARKIARESDPYGHGRAKEIENAVVMAKASAKLALAAARMRGEFHHNINIARIEGAATPPAPPQRCVRREATAEPEPDPGRPFRKPDDLWRDEPDLITAAEYKTITHEDLASRIAQRQAERAGFFE